MRLKFFVLSILFLMPLCTFAQGKYTITGHVRGCNGRAYLIDNDGITLKVFDIDEGNINVSGNISEPTKARIIYEGANYTIANFILEKGDITINGNINGNFVIGGTEDNERLADFYDNVTPIYYSSQARPSKQNLSELRTIYSKYIQDNYDNYAGAFIFSMNYVDWNDHDYYYLCDGFSRKIKKSKMMQSAMAKLATLPKPDKMTFTAALPNEEEQPQVVEEKPRETHREPVVINQEPIISDVESATNYKPKIERASVDTAAPIIINPDYVPQENLYIPKSTDELRSKVAEAPNQDAPPLKLSEEYETYNVQEKNKGNTHKDNYDTVSTTEPSNDGSSFVYDPNVSYDKYQISDEPEFINEKNKYPNILLTKPESNEIVSLNGVLKQHKYVLVDFWASWCAPCLTEVPYLEGVYKQFHKRGFEIYGVSLDKSSKRMTDVMQSYNMTWTNVIDKNGAKGYAVEYFVYSLPANFLFDSEGNIVAQNIHGKELFEKLRKLLK